MIKISELENLIIKTLSSKYYSVEDAKKIAEVYLWAELTGKNTQGILKLLGTEPSQDIEPKYAPKVIKETNSTAVIDGGGAAGPLVSQIATDLLIEKSKGNGIAIVTANNIFSSTGAIGFYARKLAMNNLIGIISTNSPRSVNYFNTIDPMFGTNPIAFGFPTQVHPIVFDMASSGITFYGLVRAKALGEEIPEGLAINNNGELTTDPDEAMKGAILPFGNSYKSAGLAMTVELIAGALSGAAVGFDEGSWGTTLIAIDPEALSGIDNFKKLSSELISKLKSSRKKDETKDIHIPGYDTEQKYKEVLESGEIDIEEKIINNLREKLNS